MGRVTGFCQGDRDEVSYSGCGIMYEHIRLFLGELLLRHSDNLSRTLQSSNMSAAAGQHVEMMTVATFQSIRSGDSFVLFWKRITKMAEEKIDEPVLRRRRKLPR